MKQDDYFKLLEWMNPHNNGRRAFDLVLQKLTKKQIEKLLVEIGDIYAGSKKEVNMAILYKNFTWSCNNIVKIPFGTPADKVDAVARRVLYKNLSNEMIPLISRTFVWSEFADNTTVYYQPKGVK